MTAASAVLALALFSLSTPVPAPVVQHVDNASHAVELPALAKCDAARLHHMLEATDDE